MHDIASSVLPTQEKALRINLDPARYGTFAEIGAGQEVVRWFFRVGGAAGTIAKSISAYDMAVSDAIYGPAERYVSRARLESMLDREYELNRERLAESRGATTAFFAFADTVAAKSYRGANEWHGWMGVKFQSHPRDRDSRILIHVRMLDRDGAAQQEALGIVGVNLLYAAFFHYHEPERLIESLLDGLGTHRIEIDMIEFSGIEFRHVDNRLMSMKLVELGLSGAAMFGPNGEVLQPSDALYKKHVLLARGNFRPVCYSHMDILRSGRERFARDLGESAPATFELAELTLRNLRGDRPEVDRSDFLARADTLAAVGKTVLISDYFEFHRLASYVARYTQKRAAFVVGAGTLAEIFDERSYAALDGGILEALGRLFRNDLTLYVYPWKNPATNELTTVETFAVNPRLRGLYDHLVSVGAIRQLENYDQRHLGIFSRDVLAMIQQGDPAFQSLVPPAVAGAIRERSMFGWRERLAAAS
ncbi:MAG TPA: hypothetical protein VFZ53_24855 [Polyangiaceae bacterium]